MGENAGAAGIAAVLAVIGFVLVVAGIRGTYMGVWQALTAKKAASGSSSSGGGSGGHTFK